jgi:electron-transferring-flavoprotein dehydrogenase
MAEADAPKEVALPVAGVRAYAGVHMWLDDLGLSALVPWTLRHKGPDSASLTPASEAAPIAYPKYDGVLTFDKLSSVFCQTPTTKRTSRCI